MGFVRRSLDRTKALLRRAISEESDPPRVALAVGLGALIGTSPLVPLHTVVALGLASLLRLNRLFAFVGSNVSFGPILPAIATAEVLLGAHLLGQPPPQLAGASVLAIAGKAIGAWWTGFAVVGPPTAAVAALLAYGFAKARERRLVQTTL